MTEIKNLQTNEESKSGSVSVTQDGSEKLTANLAKPSLGAVAAAAEIFFKTVVELYEEGGEDSGIGYELAGLSACYQGFIQQSIATHEVSGEDKLKGAVIANHFVSVVRSLGNPE